MVKYGVLAAILIGSLSVSESKAASVLEELDAANKAFAISVMAGDIDAIVNDYTDDGCVIAPMAGEACGEKAVRTFWESVIATKPKKVEIVTEKAEGEGRLAFATGKLLITDADSSVHTNRFTVVFRKVGDRWKLRVDSWNPQ